MKYTLLITLLFLSQFLSAQLANKAENISPLLIGETVPDITIKTTASAEQSILSVLANKNTVMLFYRGGWCPYCNNQLAEIQDIENEILELGYQIIAISSDSPENLVITDTKNELNYQLYSDATGELVKAMGIAFTAQDKRKERLFNYSGGLNEGFLPVPSVFITDTTGKIVFEYINPNYKTRMSSKLILAVLKNLD